MSGYIGIQPVPQATQTRDSFTATANQTSFATSGYTPEFLDVFLNGVKLAASDYTATNGSDVVLASGAAASDILEVVAYSTFEVLNPTFDGNVTFTGNASFGDNDKAIFGAGSDLQIYHDGTRSIIQDNGDGNLRIQANNLELNNADNSENYLFAANNGAVTLYHDNAAKLATTATGIDVTGNVDTSGLFRFGVNNSEVANNYLRFKSGGAAYFDHSTVGQDFNFRVSNASSLDTNAMTIDSSGNVGIGTDSPVTFGANTHGLTLNGTASGQHITFQQGGQNKGFIYNNTNDMIFASEQTGGSLTLGSILKIHIGNTERMRIDSSGKVGIGDSSPSARLEIGGMAAGEQALLIQSGRNDALSNGLARINITDVNCPFAGLQVDHAGTGAAIIANGNVLVGKTSTESMGSATAGHTFYEGGTARHTVNSGEVMNINRLNSDGSIIGFYKNGTNVGNINVVGGSIIFGRGDTALAFNNSLDAVYPINTDGGPRDNAIDLGRSNVRFDDIYATNGTIQTSDFNEKQDIASLTATEMLVGKRISALFKTFRWKDSVAEKGDNARTHTGVIAQDVQAAFTAEGLDAGDYALFISSTWWEQDVDVPAVEAVAEVLDEDGNVTTEAVEAVDAYTRTDTYDTEAEAPEGATSKTRLGIRYPELLSFVAAYNEQRFASIEARLTALEA